MASTRRELVRVESGRGTLRKSAQGFVTSHTISTRTRYKLGLLNLPIVGIQISGHHPILSFAESCCGTNTFLQLYNP